MNIELRKKIAKIKYPNEKLEMRICTIYSDEYYPEENQSLGHFREDRYHFLELCYGQDICWFVVPHWDDLCYYGRYEWGDLVKEIIESDKGVLLFGIKSDQIGEEVCKIWLDIFGDDKNDR